jgi:hypothetical protein
MYIKQYARLKLYIKITPFYAVFSMSVFMEVACIFGFFFSLWALRCCTSVVAFFLLSLLTYYSWFYFSESILLHGRSAYNSHIAGAANVVS